MMDEMRKAKEQADGGIDAVKAALADQKKETLKAFQEMQKCEAAQRTAEKKLEALSSLFSPLFCSGG
jgi:hypothetical protein